MVAVSMGTHRIRELVHKYPDGFTANFNGNIPKLSGYLVSITDNSYNKIGLRDIKKLVEEGRRINRRCFIGGWHDKKTGIYYLDISINTNDKKEALLISKMFNQKAFFDVSFKKVVYI